MQCFPVSKQWYDAHSLGFLTCAQMSMHGIVHGRCTDTVRESALKLALGEKSLIAPGIEPASVLRLAFQSDVLPTELSRPLSLDYAWACVMPHSVGTPERRCQISTDIDDNAIDLMFQTETWFRSHGMKPRSAIWRPAATPSSH